MSNETPEQIHARMEHEHLEEVARDVRITADQIASAVYLLQEGARISIPELNPDGVDQAAHSMRLVAVEALEELGETVPEQRTSMANHPSMANVCICGRTKETP